MQKSYFLHDFFLIQSLTCVLGFCRKSIFDNVRPLAIDMLRHAPVYKGCGLSQKAQKQGFVENRHEN